MRFAPFQFARRRAALLAVALLAALPLATAGGGGWWVSGRIAAGAFELEREAPQFDVRVVALGDGTVTLRHVSGPQSWRWDGVWGLQWLGGYARVGAIVTIDEEAREVVRELTPVRGALAVGEHARLDNFAFPDGPSALGLAFEEVTYRSPPGAMPAWLVEGQRSTWLVLVHGKGAGRREALRTLDAVRGLGYPALVIGYRNDVDAPPGDTTRYGYGETEWQDLEAAVRFALARGADNVVLVGYSMGGAIVASFLLRSQLADRVAGAVLDAPMLDFEATTDFRLRDAGVPSLLAAPAKLLARLRYGVDWGALDYVSRAAEFSVPFLLFHGDADEIVPVTSSERFASARPDLVTLERFTGAHHVRSWNVDRERYARALREFLGRVSPR